MKAQNRKEIFLKALANGEEPSIKPLTREEMLLKKQAKRESASGGGGAASGGGAFVVNFAISYETGTISADKTYSEIINAFNKSVIIGCVCEDEENYLLFNLVTIRPEYCTFVCLRKQSKFMPVVMALHLMNDNSVTLEVVELE